MKAIIYVVSNGYTEFLEPFFDKKLAELRAAELNEFNETDEWNVTEHDVDN